MASGSRALSCPETRGYRKTSLKSSSSEGPKAGSAKSQYQHPAASSFSPGLTQPWRQTLLSAAATAGEECGTATPSLKMQGMYVSLRHFVSDSHIFVLSAKEKEAGLRKR